ncbi:hypothetical protein HK098_007070, partial [Nowakowskiella sp. JEL0407]
IRKDKVVSYGILVPLCGFISASVSLSNDLKYWSLLLIHQLSLTESLHEALIGKGMVPILGNLTRMTFGNTNMQKLCLHSLVRLISSLSNIEATAQLQKLVELNFVPLLTSCLRNDDTELVSWTVFLLHEFVIKDVAKNDFCRVPGISKIFTNLLTSEEACVPRIILRTFKSLGLRNQPFQQEMLKSGVITKTIPLLKSNDEETQYWALALLHDLMETPEGHKELIACSGLEVLLQLANRASVHLALYIADIFVFLCSSSLNHDVIRDSKMLPAVIKFCQSDEPDLQYAGAALLLNLSTMSASISEQIISSNILLWLEELIIKGEKDSVLTVAAKTLTALSRKDLTVKSSVQIKVIPFLISKVILLLQITIQLLTIGQLDPDTLPRPDGLSFDLADEKLILDESATKLYDRLIGYVNKVLKQSNLSEEKEEVANDGIEKTEIGIFHLMKMAFSAQFEIIGGIGSFGKCKFTGELSAIRILLERAMSGIKIILEHLTKFIESVPTEQYLPVIIKACESDDENQKRKAVATIQQLTKYDENKRLLLKSGVLRILCNILKSQVHETTHRYAIIAVFRLVSNDGMELMNQCLNIHIRKDKVVSYGILVPLCGFISASVSLSNDLKYWSLLLIHQLSLTESLHEALIDKGMVPILGNLTRMTFGNTNMQKLCLHSLVRLISSLSNIEATAQLQKLVELNFVPLLTSCLRNDDTELVSWTVFLLHEFVIKDVAKNDFCRVPGISKIFTNLLTSEEACVPRIILRTFKSLGLRNQPFQQEMLKSGVITKTIPLLKSNDEETQYWALALLHDLMETPEGHKELIACSGLEVLLQLANRASVHLALYIADIFVFLCSSSLNHDVIRDSKMLPAVIKFCQSDEPDLQYAGAALLLNLSTMSASISEQIISSNILLWLEELIIKGEKDSVLTVAAKTLTALSRKDLTVKSSVQIKVIPFLISKVILLLQITIQLLTIGQLDPDTLPRPDGLSFDLADEKLILDESATKLYDRLIGYLDCMLIFIESELFSIKSKSTNIPLDVFCNTLTEMCVVPLVNTSYFVEGGDETVKKVVEGRRFLKKMIDHSENLIWTRDMDDQAVQALHGLRDLITTHTISVIVGLVKHESARESLLKDGMITVLITLIQNCSIEVQDQAMISLSHLTLRESKSNLIKYIPKFSTDAFFSRRIASPMFQFYYDLFQHSISDYSLPSNEICRLDANTKTAHLVLSSNSLSMRNDSWTFESILGNKSAKGVGVWTYEVLIESEGIIQIGWSTKASRFDPEAGSGVGGDTDELRFICIYRRCFLDNVHSYSADGNRRKKWHGNLTTNNNYGEQWCIGDTISTFLDLNKGTISFWRNGKDMGVAFTHIPKNEEWYPAISLASGQACSVAFGENPNPLQYASKDYLRLNGTFEDSSSHNSLQFSPFLRTESSHMIFDIILDMVDSAKRHGFIGIVYEKDDSKQYNGLVFGSGQLGLVQMRLKDTLDETYLNGIFSGDTIENKKVMFQRTGELMVSDRIACVRKSDGEIKIYLNQEDLGIGFLVEEIGMILPCMMNVLRYHFLEFEMNIDDKSNCSQNIVTSRQEPFHLKSIQRMTLAELRVVPHTQTFHFEEFIKNDCKLNIDPINRSAAANYTQVCKFFQRGNCQRGTNCPLKHIRNEKTVVCKHWLRGLCKKGDLCEFLHEYNLKKMPECWFYSKYKECTNPECMYLHIDPDSKVKECAWYARGFCKHGPKCRHKHARKALCPLYLTGFCPKGPECSFGHPKYELPQIYEQPQQQQQQQQQIQTIESYTSNYQQKPGRSYSDVTCFKCGEKGHYANSCPKRRQFEGTKPIPTF